jgi:hypothetical protein
MKPHLVPGEQLESLMSYFMDFAGWESQLRLYHEAKDLRDSELHLLYISGLAEVLRLHVTQEERDLLVFSQKYCCCKYEQKVCAYKTWVLLCLLFALILSKYQGTYMLPRSPFFIVKLRKGCD